MKKKYIIINKKIGETPLEAINKLKKVCPELKDEKISYAGRLDPMAEGKLLLLVGKENKKRRIYEKLDKEYEFKVLFGFSTDSDDILGKVVSKKKAKIYTTKTKVQKALNYLKKQNFQYPPIYSSVPVNGKPLYYWARKNKINKIKIPKRKIKIYFLKLLKLNNISTKKLRTSINQRILLVKGNFRQKEILSAWNKYFNKCKITRFQIAKIKIKCSSGTYIRSISKDLGKLLNSPTLALQITRTRIFI